MELINTLLLAAVAMILTILLFKNGRVNYLGVAKEFYNKEVTTVLPIPMSAATCSHDWDILSDRTLDMPHEKKQVLVLQCHKCGVIDKTVQSTSPFKAIPHEPCKHVWETIQNEKLQMPHEVKSVLVLSCKNCGLVDKTVETTSKRPPELEAKSECRHKWSIQEKAVLESAYEQMTKGRKKSGVNLEEYPKWMFRKSAIITRICNSCGTIDKTIATNFEVEEEN